MSTKRNFLIKLVSYITKIPEKALKNVKIVDTNLTEEYKKEKRRRCDIVIKINDNVVCNLEMNKDYYPSYIIKNLSYLFSLHNQENMSEEKYQVGQEYIQINFDNFKSFGKKLINEYKLKEETTGEDYPLGRIKVFHIKLDYLQNIKYTESVNKKLVQYLKFIGAKSYEEIIETIEGDEILEDVFNEMVRFAKKIPFGYRDVEYEERLLRNSIREEGRIEGEKKGKAEGLIEGAAKGKAEGLIEGEAKGLIEGKNMAIVEMCSAGADKNFIAKAFNISMEKLDEILKNNKESR